MTSQRHKTVVVKATQNAGESMTMNGEAHLLSVGAWKHNEYVDSGSCWII